MTVEERQNEEGQTVFDVQIEKVSVEFSALEQSEEIVSEEVPVE